MLPLNLKTYYCFCLFLLGINHLLAQTFFQSPHSYQRVDVQINAGADTTVCGYKHHLIGDPIGGTWTIDCVSAPAVVVISPSASDTTLITVAACGMYDFIYSVDVGGGIMTQDTIRIAFQDPNSATQNVFVNYAYIIDIGDCPPIEDWEVNYTPPTCVNNEQVGGSISFNDGNSLALMNPPTPQETTVDGEIVITCWRQLFIPEVFDTFLSDCLADSIHISEVITNDTTDAMFTITQQDYIMIDPMTGDTLVNLYTQLEDSLNTILTNYACVVPTNSCLIDMPDCPLADNLVAIYDTIIYEVPVYLGTGHWEYLPKSLPAAPTDIWTPLTADTTYLSIGNLSAALIATPSVGAAAFNIGLYSYTAPNFFLPLSFNSSTEQLAYLPKFRWVRNISTYPDTVIHTRYIPYCDGQPCVTCPSCGGNSSIAYNILEPPPPPPPCPEGPSPPSPPMPPAPDIDINGTTTPSICGIPNGTVSATAVGGIPPLSITNNGYLSNLTFGVYTISATDINGCTTSRDFFVDEWYPQLDASITTTPATCQSCNGSVYIVVSSASTFSINFNGNISFSNTLIANGLCPGNYSFSVSNECGSQSYNFTIYNTPGSSNNINISQTTCNQSDAGVQVQHYINWYGCDSTVTTTTTLLPSENQVIHLTTCNLAEVGEVSDTYLNSAGCDSIVTTVTTLLPSQSTTNYFYTCDTTLVDSVSNFYINSVGCDSIVTNIIRYTPPLHDTMYVSTCDSMQAGIITHSYFNIGGCDSTITTITTFLPSNRDTLQRTTCYAAEVGIVTNEFINIFGCDSIVTTITTLLPSQFDTLEYTTCDASQAGIMTILYTNTFGCDSTVTNITTLLPSNDLTIEHTTCDATEAGSVVNSYTNQFGCDSIVTTITTLIPSTYLLLNEVLCEGEFYTLNNRTYHESGIYHDTLQNAAGCDSTITLSLTVYPRFYYLQEYHFWCEGDSIQVGNQYYTAPGDYTLSGVSEHGCDSTYLIHILRAMQPYCDSLSNNLYIPNAFSPNGDGFNDHFQPYSSVVQFKEMMIFDRWGNELFRTEAATPRWNGESYGKPLNPGVFVYILRCVTRNGREFIKTGDVTIVK